MRRDLHICTSDVRLACLCVNVVSSLGIILLAVLPALFKQRQKCSLCVWVEGVWMGSCLFDVWSLRAHCISFWQDTLKGYSCAFELLFEPLQLHVYLATQIFLIWGWPLFCCCCRVIQIWHLFYVNVANQIPFTATVNWPFKLLSNQTHPWTCVKWISCKCPVVSVSCTNSPTYSQHLKWRLHWF